MTDTGGRSVPPGFIIDSCQCIESLLRSKGVTVTVEPEALRRLRSGRPTVEDSEMMKVLLEDLCNGSQQCMHLVQNHEPAAFLLLCWLITRNGLWQEFLAPSLLQQSRLHVAIPVPPLVARSAATDIDSGIKQADAEVVAMKYRTVVQLLNQYHELDRSRVMIFKDIYQMLTDIAKLPEAAGAASSTADGTDAEFSLSHSALARVLDNLWTTATLVDRQHTSAPAPASGKQSGGIGVARGGNSGAAGKEKGGAATSHHHVPGAELLRTEHDALRQWCSEAQQYAASEAAFLKWASAAAEPEHLRTFHLPIPPAATAAQASGRSDTQPPPSPQQQLGGASTISNTSADTRSAGGDGTHAEQQLQQASELSNIVHKCIPMMGELEQCMLELAELGALDFAEICTVSSAIDSNYDDLGLTVGEIDAYVNGLESSGGNSECAQHEGGGESSEREVNIFELLDSECGGDSSSTGNGLAGGDMGNAYRRQLQQQLRLPWHPAQRELDGLRQLHEHTLRRTAKACEKFSPFEMVWQKEAAK